VPAVIADTAHLGRALGPPTPRQIGYGVAFLSLGTIAVGSFLPVAAEGSVGFDRIEGNSLWPSGIGLLTLALCGLLAIALTRSLHHGGRTWGPFIVGLLVLAQTVYIGASELTTCPVGPLAAGSTCQTASPGLGLFMIAAGGAALALAGVQLAPWTVRSRAAAPARHHEPESATTYVPPAAIEADRLTPADVDAYLIAIRTFAEETARHIIDDAYAEAALITSTALQSRAVDAERQLHVAEAAATARVERLLQVSLSVQEHLGGALRELRAVRESAYTQPPATPPEQPTVSAGDPVLASSHSERDGA
jgi:hypothetical protein